MTYLYWLALVPLLATFWLCVSSQMNSYLGRKILLEQVTFMLKFAGTAVAAWLFFWGIANLLSR